MKMRALNHINLVVTDVERSATFYETLFGLERRSKVGEFVFMGCGDTDLGLVAGEAPVHDDLHIGFRVETKAQVDAWLKRLQAQGMPIAHGPEDFGHYYTFTVKDPDGYGVEVYCEPERGGRAGYPVVP